MINLYLDILHRNNSITYYFGDEVFEKKKMEIIICTYIKTNLLNTISMY